MEKVPAISVVVPVYNVEIYVKQCVDSILNQTFQDFEIILVDDASPDRSFEICQRLYGGNDKVKFVRHEKNLGLGPARNTGMKNARGKYVYFVDSDDFILPEALEKFYNVAEKNDAQVVHVAGRYELVQSANDPVGKGTLTLRWEGYSQEGFLKNDLKYRLDKHWATYDTRSNAWLCFCRRDFLEANHIEFLPIISEDEPFSFVLFCLTERYYILREAFYVHLLRAGSIMRSVDLKRLSRGIQAMIFGAVYLEKFLDCLPRFEGYELWRENLMSVFFNRFLQHTKPYYSNLNMSSEINSVLEKTLRPSFGDNESFVRFFFNGYHLYSRYSEYLFQQDQYKGQLISLFIREQPAILELINAVKSEGKRVFLMDTPDHGNLGDHAIALSEYALLEEYFPDHKVIEISRDYLVGELGELLWGLGLEKYFRRSDVIFLLGGGNLGNLWIINEKVRQLLISKFPANKIVIFPQSIYFTEDADGRRELEQSKKVYNAHKDLHLMLRDENSFEFAQKIFPEIRTYLLPDVVTTLHGIMDDVDVKREGVLFILRRDKEKVRDDAKIQILQECFNEYHIPFEVIDNVVNEKVTLDKREPKVRALLAKIRQSKLVVTDRFHGVIFSFITRTPVIAFKSFDTKISSGIKWLKNFPSVFYAQDQNWTRIEDFINQVFGNKNAFEELAPSVRIDTKELFYRTLKEILRSNEKKLINSPPPRLPAAVDSCVKRIFTLHIPLSICNFRCHYCYLAQRAEHYQGVQPEMKYSPEQIARALSPKRLGGKAYFNICAEGETLLLKNLDAYVKRLAEDGHFIEIVTNCTITPMLEKILSWERELLEQVEFKCSFHWLELKKRKLLKLFARNVNKIWEAGASANVEITPSDELIPHIDEIKKFSLENFGALPHITIARDDRTRGIDILTKLSKEDYYKTWGQFDSAFFDYKTTIYGKRQEEFCYAGKWSAWIDMSTGQAKACYCGRQLGDVFADPNSNFPEFPVGKCTIAHCYNGHFWLTFGNIPLATNLTYADMRNRIRSDGREWLQPKLKKFYSTQLRDNNVELSDAEKLKFMIMNRLGLS